MTTFRALTPRQERFAREFAVSGNARRAAIQAGFSARSAKQIGSAILKKPHVRRALEALRRQDTPDEAVLTREWALSQLLQEIGDPNPRIRLDAKKSVAQAVGVFSQKKEEVPCRCATLTQINGLDSEELELRVAGTSRDRVVSMSERDFTQWAQSVRDQAENWIRLGQSVRKLAQRLRES